jgi:hypothetical protein
LSIRNLHRNRSRGRSRSRNRSANRRRSQRRPRLRRQAHKRRLAPWAPNRLARRGVHGQPHATARTLARRHELALPNAERRAQIPATGFFPGPRSSSGRELGQFTADPCVSTSIRSNNGLQHSYRAICAIPPSISTQIHAGSPLTTSGLTSSSTPFSAPKTASDPIYYAANDPSARHRTEPQLERQFIKGSLMLPKWLLTLSAVSQLLFGLSAVRQARGDNAGRSGRCVRRPRSPPPSRPCAATENRAPARGRPTHRGARGDHACAASGVESPGGGVRG